MLAIARNPCRRLSRESSCVNSVLSIRALCKSVNVSDVVCLQSSHDGFGTKLAELLCSYTQARRIQREPKRSYFNSDHCYLLSSEQELVSRFGEHRPGWQVGNLATGNSAILRSHLRAAPRGLLTFALIPPTADRGVLCVIQVACTINLHHRLCRAGCLSRLAWSCCMHGWAGVSYTFLCLPWFSAPVYAQVYACVPA